MNIKDSLKSPTAVYIETKNPGQEPNVKGIALVQVDDGQGCEGSIQEVEVSYWPSLISQWTADGVKVYVCAEALFMLGFHEDARTLAVTGGTWGQEWADQHPDPEQGLG
ncbi:MAG TPA: hypothetical protein VN426_06045 [Syntrophomonadaceae bacterium]|nr:hypothetical protein [Syntrophomonadaceae bacterium]